MGYDYSTCERCKGMGFITEKPSSDLYLWAARPCSRCWAYAMTEAKNRSTTLEAVTAEKGWDRIKPAPLVLQATEASVMAELIEEFGPEIFECEYKPSEQDIAPDTSSI